MPPESPTERPTDPDLLAYWLMAKAAISESPTGVDGLASAVLALIPRASALHDAAALARLALDVATQADDVLTTIANKLGARTHGTDMDTQNVRYRCEILARAASGTISAIARAEGKD